MNYTNLRFPVFLARFAWSEISFSTVLSSKNNGRELRKVKWPNPVRYYYMRNIKCNQRQIEEIKTFHQLHKGKAYSFRFPDQFDYIGRDELLGIGDGKNTEFQLLKGYHYSGRTEYRQIKQPIPDSVKLKISGVEAGPEFACHSDGIVKLTQPPDLDSRITADFEFDIMARFDMDELQISPGEDGSLVLDELLVKEVI